MRVRSPHSHTSPRSASIQITPYPAPNFRKNNYFSYPILLLSSGDQKVYHIGVFRSTVTPSLCKNIFPTENCGRDDARFALDLTATTCKRGPLRPESEIPRTNSDAVGGQTNDAANDKFAAHFGKKNFFFCFRPAPTDAPPPAATPRKSDTKRFGVGRPSFAAASNFAGVCYDGWSGGTDIVAEWLGSWVRLSVTTHSKTLL